MKPPPFEYFAPQSVEEALELLGRYGSDARLLAGGQSLVPLMNFRLAAPPVLIDLNRVAELSYIREENGQVRIGTMTRQRTIEFSPVVREKLPILAEATKLVGHLPTRTRGTIGGSLAHADPAAEYPCVGVALHAELVLRGPHGIRNILAVDFFKTFFTSALQPDEILAEVRIPVVPAKTGWAFIEFSRRHGDFAIVEVAALLTAEHSRCLSARVAVSGVGPIPLRLRPVEEMLERAGLDENSVAAASRRAAELVDPPADLHASSDYRRHLTRVLTQRCLKTAISRAELNS
jgi:aerobic carbon-monoxide dehydrogenase medium subunit